MKESLFAILGAQVVDAVVLDLFAGTGALGFEALSRGASWVTFVDSDPRSSARLRATALELGLSDGCEAIVGPAERVAARLHRAYDLVFLDPPYALGFPQAALDSLRERNRLQDGALVVYEHSARTPFGAGAYRTVREERYGEVAISFLKLEATS